MADTKDMRIGWRRNQQPQWSDPVGEAKTTSHPVMPNGPAISSNPPSLSAVRDSGSFPFVNDTNNSENRLSEIRLADITTSQRPLVIPKSRTFSVLSSITHSFSRGSVTSRDAGSRNVSEESRKSSITSKGITHRPVSHLAQKYEGHNSPASPTSATLISPAGRLLANPKAVTRAMPPQYWAGRFMALHDQFHNELLEPFQLAQVCKAQAAQTPLSESTSQASAATQNNPSTSAYAITRPVQKGKHAPGHSDSLRQPSRIPQSATSGAILQSTPCNVHLVQAPSSPRHPSTGQTTTTIRAVPHHPSSGSCNSKENQPSLPEHPPVQPITTVATSTATALPHCTKDDVDNEENRTRRVFHRLAQHCETDAARASLRA